MHATRYSANAPRLPFDSPIPFLRSVLRWCCPTCWCGDLKTGYRSCDWCDEPFQRSFFVTDLSTARWCDSSKARCPTGVAGCRLEACPKFPWIPLPWVLLRSLFSTATYCQVPAPRRPRMQRKTASRGLDATLKTWPCWLRYLRGRGLCTLPI